MESSQGQWRPPNRVASQGCSWYALPIDLPQKGTRVGEGEGEKENRKGW